MPKLVLEGIVDYSFRFLNSRERCDFIAYFPEEGTTQKEMLEARVLGISYSRMMNHYMTQYNHFIDVPEKTTNRCKVITLNEDGHELQRIARYMILANEKLNLGKEERKDYLNLFIKFGKPKRMLELIGKIYFNGTHLKSDLFNCSKKSDRYTRKLIQHLESFGLVKTGSSGHLKNSEIIRTKTGKDYFYQLLLPVTDYISATCEKYNCVLYQEVERHWNNFVKKNGLGWPSQTKVS